MCAGWSPGLLIVFQSTCLRILLCALTLLFPCHICCILTGSALHFRSLHLRIRIVVILRYGTGEDIGLTGNVPFLTWLTVVFALVLWWHCTTWCLCWVADFWWCDVVVWSIWYYFSTLSPTLSCLHPWLFCFSLIWGVCSGVGDPVMLLHLMYLLLLCS